MYMYMYRLLDLVCNIQTESHDCQYQTYLLHSWYFGRGRFGIFIQKFNKSHHPAKITHNISQYGT